MIFLLDGLLHGLLLWRFKKNGPSSNQEFFFFYQFSWKYCRYYTPPPFQCLFILAKLHRFSIDGIFMLKMFICIASSSSYSISLHNGTTLESTNLIQIQQSYRNPFYKRNFSKELIQWKPARKQTEVFGQQSTSIFIFTLQNWMYTLQKL